MTFLLNQRSTIFNSCDHYTGINVLYGSCGHISVKATNGKILDNTNYKNID